LDRIRGVKNVNNKTGIGMWMPAMMKTAAKRWTQAVVELKVETDLGFVIDGAELQTTFSSMDRTRMQTTHPCRVRSYSI
jgi:hypothetical protein